VVGTAAGRLEGIENVQRLLRDQFTPRKGKAAQVREPRTSIESPERPLFEIVDDFRPQLLRFADDHAVGMPDRLLGQHGGVDPPQDHGHVFASAPEGVRYAIGFEGGARSRADRNQVDVLVEIDLVHGLIGQRDLHLRRNRGGDGRTGQAEEMDDLSPLVGEKGRVGGYDDLELHFPSTFRQSRFRGLGFRAGSILVVRVPHLVKEYKKIL